MQEQMALKCNICGGELVKLDENAFRCASCDQKVYLSDDYLANRVEFNIAQNDMKKLDFDGASITYNSIISKGGHIAEAYWGLVLCENGIEFVNDNGKNVPIFHDVSVSSVFNSENYRLALQYANNTQREEFVALANEIERVRKDICQMIDSCEYDVFLCQKINRLEDSTIRTKEFEYSYKLYYELTKLGYKVFLSAVSLGGGVESDASIFNALYSAKVLVVIGANRENLESSWVKSEWNRFYNMISCGLKERGSLIPIILDGDESILPTKIRRLQYLDIKNPSYMDDLKYAISKIITPKNSKTCKDSFNDLLQNGYLCLERHDFDNAEEYFKDFLKINDSDSRGYIGLLLCDLRLENENKLSRLSCDLGKYENFNKALFYATLEQKDRYIEYQKACQIKSKQGKDDLNKIYGDFSKKSKNSNKTDQFKEKTDEFVEKLKTNIYSGVETIKDTTKKVFSSTKKVVKESIPKTVPYENLKFSKETQNVSQTAPVDKSYTGKNTAFKVVGVIGMIQAWLMFWAGIAFDYSTPYIAYVSVMLFCVFISMYKASRVTNPIGYVASFTLSLCLVVLASVILIIDTDNSDKCLSLMVMSIVSTIIINSIAKKRALSKGSYIIESKEKAIKRSKRVNTLFTVATIVSVLFTVIVRFVTK